MAWLFICCDWGFGCETSSSDLARRLASGDSEGTVAVWDVPSALVIAKMDTASKYKDVMKDRKLELGVVHDLAWVCARPCMLAVVMAPATLLVWDTSGTTFSAVQCASTAPSLLPTTIVASVPCCNSPMLLHPPPTFHICLHPPAHPGLPL
jgi:WD40 repeat protein